MKCPACESEVTRVFDTRGSDTDRVKRRRRCEHCGHTFTTYETVPPERLSLITPRGVVRPLDADHLVDVIAGHARAAVRRALRGLAASVSDPETPEAEEVRA